MNRYPLLLKALKDWCDENNLTEVTKQTYIGDANRIFEALIPEFSEEEIRELMRKRGFTVKDSAYLSVIEILKTLVSQRPRTTAE